MTTLLWSVLGFLAGAMPFSVWTGRWAASRDIRLVGDGNPGATNVFLAAGPGWGLLAMLLDFFKAALPVGLATYVQGVTGPGLVAVALAPVLGHAFSPFLGWRGGKALAATFGIWAGLTVFLAPLVLGVLFAVWIRLVRPAAWAVVGGFVGLIGALLWLDLDPWWPVVWLGNFLLLLWTHRHELRRPPEWRWRRT